MASAQPRSFADLLRRFRIAAGLTQEELAEQAGLSRRAIGALETGARRAPHKETVSLLATALGLTVAERALLESAARQRLPSTVTAAHTDPAAGRETRWPSADAEPAPPLVGRQQELVALERHLAGEGPPLLVLIGESGIGKSRLLEETMRRAAAQGWTILGGGCHRRSGQEPYEPCVTALTRFLATRSVAQQRLDLQGCAWLVRLLPELAAHAIGPAPSWTLPPEQERRLLFSAVGRFLANIASPAAGTLLVLDDLHWAGSDALDLLAALLREPGSQPLRIVAAYRDTDVAAGDPLPLLLGDLAREGLAVRINLPPLAREEARDLLAELLASHPEEIGEWNSRSELADVVLDRCGGLPFFLVSWAQELRTGALSIDDAQGTVPGSAAESIRQRVAVLPAVASSLLAMAAVVGRQVPRAVLLAAAKLAEQDEASILVGLDIACRARLLSEAPDGSFVFPHDLIRETIAADLGGARRAAIHRRIARALEGQPQALRQAAALAWHFAEGDEPAQALPYALQAGDQAGATSAHAEAERHYRLAHKLAIALGDPQRAAETSEKLGLTLNWLGHHDEALRLLESALDAARERHDWPAVVRIALPLTRPYVDQGRPHDGIARIERLRQALASHESPPSAVIALDLGLTHLYYGTNQYVEMLAAAERALAALQALDDSEARPETRAHALWRRGAALLLLARPEEALLDLEQAASLAAQAGHPPTSIWAWYSAAIARLHVGDLTAALAVATHALAAAEAFGAPAFLTAQLSLTAQIALDIGDAPRASQLVARAEHMHPGVSAGWARLMIAEVRSQITLADGDIKTAKHALGATLADAEQSGDLQRLRAVQRLLAECDLLAGDASSAVARLTPLLDRAGMVEMDVNPLLPLLARAQLDLGQTERAASLIAQTCERLRSQRDRYTLAEALQVAGLVHLRQRRWEDARDALEEAVASAQAMSNPYAEAKALYVYGQLHAAQGELELAHEKYQAGLAILRRLGERLYAERIERAQALLAHARPF